MAYDPSQYSGAAEGYATKEQLAAAQALANTLMKPQQQTMYQPWQGVANVADALIGGYFGHLADLKQLGNMQRSGQAQDYNSMPQSTPSSAAIASAVSGSGQSAPDGSIFATTTADRTRGDSGYGSPMSGTVDINGHSYNFVTGGHGRGSIPFGNYSIGGAENHPYLGGTSFPLNDVYDPYTGDNRTGLFIHRGRNATAGCIGINAGQWDNFEKDMRAAGPKSLVLRPPQQNSSQ